MIDYIPGENAQHLDEFTKDEWRSVVRSLRPNLTETEFDRMWEEFEKQKRMHS